MNSLEFNKKELVNLEKSLKKEVLRTNRAGSYSCTTVIGCNTRKYHGLLVTPLPALDGGRHVLLSSLDETIIQHDCEFNLGLHKYEGDNYEPKGHKYITDFKSNPIPTLVYRVGGVLISKEKILVYNEPRILIKYTLLDAHSETKIRFKPFLAFRNIHALSKANMDANTKVREVENGISARLYSPYPDLYIQSSKKCEFVPAPDWYYNIEYMKEQSRGYDFKEDLFVPGYFETSIKKGESIIISAGLNEANPQTLKTKFSNEIKNRVPRNSFTNFLINSASQFFMTDGKQTHILAGYPWLPARTRDALIALPGLLNGSQNPTVYKSVLATILSHSDGCLMSEFTNTDSYEFQSDIALWFIWCVQQLEKMFPDDNIWKQYGKEVKKILNSYLTQSYHFKVDDNGLIYNNHSTVANTWMNAVIGGRPVTSRNGYAVETNALWYNAIEYALAKSHESKDHAFIKAWEPMAVKARENYSKIFWSEEKGYLADHVNEYGANWQMRPNQVIACALDYCPLEKDQIKKAFRLAESQLLTPYGMRSLSPSDSQYISLYKGNQDRRENAAYNGSVWPWLISFYIDTLAKIQPKMLNAKIAEFVDNFEKEMTMAGICSISELYHGDPPYKGKGAISFAMNTACLLKLVFQLNSSAAKQEVNETVVKKVAAKTTKTKKVAAPKAKATNKATTEKKETKKGKK